VSPEAPAPRRTNSERGTSTLEVAGLAPLVLIVAFVLVNAGFVLYGVSAAQTAARQAARAYSLGQDPHTAARGALPGWLGSDVTTFAPGHGVRVRVDLPDLVPGTNLSVTREAVMP
jgi:hypothetical protein